MFTQIKFVASFLLLTFSSLSSQDLDQHRWEQRVILIFGQPPKADLFQQQLKLLSSTTEKLDDRDLIIYRFFAGKGWGPDDNLLEMPRVEPIRSRYNPNKNDFQFVLIGKDGGVKLQSEQVVEMNQLFGLIDSMPMRRAEMRRNKKE